MATQNRIGAQMQPCLTLEVVEILNDSFCPTLIRMHSIPPLNLDELKEDKPVQFAAEMTTPSSRKRKRNGYLMRVTQQSAKREKQKAKIRTDIKN